MEMRNKVKIAIVTHKMVMGGIEKSLITLITELQKVNADITLYLEEFGGELFEDLPKGIQKVEIFKNESNSFALIGKLCKQREFRKAVAVIQTYICNKLCLDPVKGWKYTSKYLDIQKEEYDYVFAYGAPISFSVVFADYNLNALNKYAWIHNEIDSITLEAKKYPYLFRNFDKIICVSQKAEKIFDGIFPEYSERSMTFYNYLNRAEIINKSKENVGFSYKGLKILTIGRVCYDKGQDIIPDIVKKLSKEGYQFKWYCIGDGDFFQSVKSKIEMMGLSERIILLGNKDNPYPYLKEADIYCQPSRKDGFGITISEAKIFGLPIVATDFAGASEQLTNGETGFIVKFDVDEVYHALKTLLDNKNVAEKFRNNLRDDKKSCVSKVEELISIK